MQEEIEQIIKDIENEKQSFVSAFVDFIIELEKNIETYLKIRPIRKEHIEDSIKKIKKVIKETKVFINDLKYNIINENVNYNELTINNIKNNNKLKNIFNENISDKFLKGYLDDFRNKTLESFRTYHLNINNHIVKLARTIYNMPKKSGDIIDVTPPSQNLQNIPNTAYASDMDDDDNDNYDDDNKKTKDIPHDIDLLKNVIKSSKFYRERLLSSDENSLLIFRDEFNKNKNIYFKRNFIHSYEKEVLIVSCINTFQHLFNYGINGISPNFIFNLKDSKAGLKDFFKLTGYPLEFEFWDDFLVYLELERTPENYNYVYNRNLVLNFKKMIKYPTKDEFESNYESFFENSPKMVLPNNPPKINPKKSGFLTIPSAKLPPKEPEDLIDESFDDKKNNYLDKFKKLILN